MRIFRLKIAIILLAKRLEMMKNNILENIILDKSSEEFMDLISTKKVRIERIVSNGQTSEENFWYDQDENEFVIVLEGNAVLEIEEEGEIKTVELNKNDYINIKAHTKHRVAYTDTSKPTVWLAVFY